MKIKKTKKTVPSVMPVGVPGYSRGLVISDPFGSYTGRPVDATEEPVQDADDL